MKINRFQKKTYIANSPKNRNKDVKKMSGEKKELKKSQPST